MSDCMCASAYEIELPQPGGDFESNKGIVKTVKAPPQDKLLSSQCVAFQQ